MSYFGSTELDLHIETREDAISWDPVLVAPAVVDGVLLVARLAILHGGLRLRDPRRTDRTRRYGLAYFVTQM